jgi:hypothetical protein
MRPLRLVFWLILMLLMSGCAAPGLTIPTSTVRPAASPLASTPASIPSEQPLTQTPARTGNVVPGTSYPPLKTNGPYLVYLRGQDKARELVLMDADGKGQKALPFPMNSDASLPLPALSHLVSPDGKWLAYYSGSDGGCTGLPSTGTADLTLNLMSLSDGKTKIVTPLLSKDYPANFDQAALELGRSDISARDLQFAFVCGLTNSIDWSPDGHELAFAGQIDGLSSDLYVYDVLSGNIRRMSSGPEEIQWVSWSPDGKWILDGSTYWVGEGMKCNIYATASDGSNTHLLSTGIPQFVEPRDWLNTHTYFETYGDNGPGTYGLHLVDVETGGKVEIWNGSYDSLAFLPDGFLAALNANTPTWPYPYSSGDFSTGPFLVNLGTLQQIRVKALGPWGCCPGYNIKAFNRSGEQAFLIRDRTDGSIDFVAGDGTLTPTGVQADEFSPSPDGQTWIAVNDQIRIFSRSGALLLTAALPAGIQGNDLQDFLWREDSSGFFFPAASSQLYAMDLVSGEPILVESGLSATEPSGYAWIH